MSIFSPVELSWGGRDFTIPPDRVMGAIATIEEIITLGELASMQGSNKINLSKIAKAYAAVLRYAGAEVTWEESYAAIFNGQGADKAVRSVQTLLYMMIPPKNTLGLAAEGPSKPVGKGKAGSSSKRRTKRPSA